MQKKLEKIILETFDEKKKRIFIETFRQLKNLSPEER
jgi:hypothetical protein